MVEPHWDNMDIVLGGGYPPECWQGNGLNTISMPATPIGVIRVILAAEVYGSADAQRNLIQLVRNNIAFQIASPMARASTRQYVYLKNTISLKPGDFLRATDDVSAGFQVYLYVFYVDVVPDQPVFRKGRRG